MSNSFLYQNAPLVELIAEIHWKIPQVKSIPGAYLDPYFEIIREKFDEWARERELGKVETLIPKDFPSELLPNKPHHRFRRGPDRWPLYQLGPGLMTANIVPPYNGWAAFRNHLAAGFEALVKFYPLGTELPVSRVELRYINAFRKKHGLTSYQQFINDHLSLPCTPGNNFFGSHVTDNTEPTIRFEVNFSCKDLPASFGTIRVSPGQVHEEAAVILELVVYSPFANPIPWFDKAHATISAWFSDLTSETLKTAMGPKLSLGGVDG